MRYWHRSSPWIVANQRCCGSSRSYTWSATTALWQQQHQPVTSMDVIFKGGSLLYTQLSTAARMALLLPRYVYANVAGSPAAAQPHPGVPPVLAGQAGTSSCLLPAQHTSPNRAWLVQAPRFTRGGCCTAGGSQWPTALSEWTVGQARLHAYMSTEVGPRVGATLSRSWLAVYGWVLWRQASARCLTGSACGLLLLPACPCVCVCLRYAVRMVLLDLSQPPPWFVQQQAHDHLSLAAAQAFAGTDGEQQEQGRPSGGGSRLLRDLHRSQASHMCQQPAAVTCQQVLSCTRVLCWAVLLGLSCCRQGAAADQPSGWWLHAKPYLCLLLLCCRQQQAGQVHSRGALGEWRHTTPLWRVRVCDTPHGSMAPATHVDWLPCVLEPCQQLQQAHCPSTAARRRAEAVGGSLSQRLPLPAVDNAHQPSTCAPAPAGDQHPLG